MQTLEKADALIAVLCGLPGSGKTSLAAGIIEIAEHHGVAAHHLCLDNIFEHHNTTKGLKSNTHACKGTEACDLAEGSTSAAAAGGAVCKGRQQQEIPAVFSADAWKVSRKQLLQEVQLQLQQWRTHQPPKLQQQEQQQRLLLLVDDINHYSSMRYEFVKLARDYGAGFLQVYMDCALGVAQQRNQQRAAAAVVPEAVLQRLAASFEPPQPGKHAWEAAHTLVVECDSNAVAMLGGASAAAAEAVATAEDAQGLARVVYEQLLLHWGAALQPHPTEDELEARRAAGQAGNAASLLHQLDLVTRHMLHAALAAATQEARSAAAALLNAKRKQLIQQLRQQQQQSLAMAGPAGDVVVAQLADVFRQLCERYL